MVHTVDAFAGLLDGPRAREAFLLQLLMEPPWSIWVDDHSALSMSAVLRGEAWLTMPGHEPVRLGPGDVSIVRGPDPYLFANPADRPPDVVALPGGQCTLSTGEDVVDALRRGVRSWGSADAADCTEVIVGAYEHVSELGRRLLDALPAVLVVRRDQLDSPLVEVLHREITRDEPGQQAVLDRLLDLLVVAVLRTWFAGAGGEAPGWIRATADPVVGPAMRLLEANPGHDWTVAGLAAEVGCSRATLARRFTELVGEPPMSFLTERRLSLAADLLLEPGTTVGAVAGQVGYASPFALSTAFKRHHGHSPSVHRAGAGSARLPG
jgi:AraC-like DNA-binding protein